MLLGFATISVSIAIIQQGRSERALDALRDLTSPRALVIRDGQRVASRDARSRAGDVVVLTEGDRVPADGVLVSGDHLEIDESLLTGESLAVRKRATREIPAQLAPPGGENSSQVFSGTLVVRGTGLAADPRHRRAQRHRQRSAASLAGTRARTAAPAARDPPHGRWCSRALGLALSVLAVLLYWSAARRLARRRCSAASRSAWRCCPRSFRWCSPCSW